MSQQMQKKLTAWVLAPALAILAGLMGTALVQQHLFSQEMERITVENEAVRMRVAEANSRQATRSVHIDENGVAQHTLCSGGGWCVTDRVPPTDWNAPENQNSGSSIPTFDVEAFCGSVLALSEAERSTVAQALSPSEQSLVKHICGKSEELRVELETAASKMRAASN